MNNDDIKKLKEINGQLSAPEILRGFEITRGNGIATGMKYAASFLAASQCAADVKWLASRHPTKNYEMRAIVSQSREARPVNVDDVAVTEPSVQAVDEANVVGLDPMIAQAMEMAELEGDEGNNAGE